MSGSDLDIKLEEFLAQCKSKPIDDWVLEPISELTREGISQEKLLSLVLDEAGKETYFKVQSVIDKNNEPEKLEGIGGWMILPLIGVVWTALLATKTVFIDVANIFQPEVWSALTVPGGAGYHPAWAAIGYATLIANIVLIVGAIVLMYFLFKKLKIFPKGMIVFYFVIFAFVLAEFVTMNFVLFESFPEMKMQLEGKMYIGLFRALIGVCIWVPYFLSSQRVKNTFVN